MPRGVYERPPLVDRFWAKVDRRGSDECWEWQGARQPEGYGQFFVDGRAIGAHRFAYELLVGPIPEGLTIDHLCRNQPCVNAAHLEPVTNDENMRRHWVLQTHCKRGHEFTPENTRRYGNYRQCRTCRAENQRRQRAEARANA